MSCSECEKAWETLEGSFPVRVDVANVHIVACRKHAAVVIEALRKALP